MRNFYTKIWKRFHIHNVFVCFLHPLPHCQACKGFLNQSKNMKNYQFAEAEYLCDST